MAFRRCPCGAQLDAVGRRASCLSCGAPAASWLVALEDGELVGAGSAREALVLPAVLHQGLGLSDAVLERAAAPGFDAVVRAERHAAADAD